MTNAILLATDGSEYAHAAAERAVELADQRGVSLYVLCVVDKRKLSEPGLSSMEYETIQAEDHGHECLKEVSSIAEEAGITIEGDVRHGVPPELIMEYADDIDADTIVIGEHGDHAEHLSGVGQQLVDNSDREVLVVSDGA